METGSVRHIFCLNLCPDPRQHNPLTKIFADKLFTGKKLIDKRVMGKRVMDKIKGFYRLPCETIKPFPKAGLVGFEPTK